MASADNRIKTAAVLDKVKNFIDTGRQQRVQALENTAAYYAKNVSKPTVLDKVKNFVDVGRQQQVQAIEDTARYYADWIKENDRALWNRYITIEEDVTQPTTLGSISPTGDDELDAYLQDISARANRATDNSRTAVNISNDDDRWLKAGAFSDGWQHGDLSKTAAATFVDANKNLAAGALGLGEKAADSAVMLGAWLYGGLMPAEERSIYPVYSFSMDDRGKEKQRAAEFAAKELYDEDAISERLYANFLERRPDIDLENDSILGSKSRNLAREAGELATVYGLQAMGVPWWLTTGISSFGSEAEHAVNEGASYDEAATSGLISAGAEIFMEAISKGLKYKGVTENSNQLRKISQYVSSEFAKTAIDLGLSALDQGWENVLAKAIEKFGRWLTYQDEKTFREVFLSKDALKEAADHYFCGFILGFLHPNNEGKNTGGNNNSPVQTTSTPASNNLKQLSD